MKLVKHEVTYAESWRVTHLKLCPRNRRSLNAEVLGDTEVGGAFAAEGEGLTAGSVWCRPGRTGGKTQGAIHDRQMEAYRSPSSCYLHLPQRVPHALVSHLFKER